MEIDAPITRKPLPCDEAYEIVVKKARALERSTKLTARDKRAVDFAVALIGKVGDLDSHNARYQCFLCDAAQTCSRQCVLLCATLGQRRISNMNKRNKRQLLARLKAADQEALFNSPAISTLSEKYIPLPGKAGTHTPSVATPDSRMTVTSAYASLEGITKVFNKYIHDVTLRKQIQIDGLRCSTALITMSYPVWGGSIQCLMSLDIRRSEMAYLARVLFGVELTLDASGSVLNMVLPGGIAVSVPASTEVKLGGTRDDAIVEVFGPEILGAIKDCPIEDAKGRVTMNITQSTLIINLILGVDRSLDFERDLYPQRLAQP